MERQLSKKYQDKILKVNIPGYEGYAWDRNTALSFLNDEEEWKKYAILGGDVLKVVDGQMMFDYCFWGESGGRDPRTPFIDYAVKCRNLSFEYITKYPNIPNVLFVFVMSSEPTAGL